MKLQLPKQRTGQIIQWWVNQNHDCCASSRVLCSEVWVAVKPSWSTVAEQPSANYKNQLINQCQRGVNEELVCKNKSSQHGSFCLQVQETKWSGHLTWYDAHGQKLSMLVQLGYIGQTCKSNHTASKTKTKIMNIQRWSGDILIVILLHRITADNLKGRSGGHGVLQIYLVMLKNLNKKQTNLLPHRKHVHVHVPWSNHVYDNSSYIIISTPWRLNT